ncbi:MAG: DMT family transporter [Candidatus Dormibacteria bacterium]
MTTPRSAHPKGVLDRYSPIFIAVAAALWAADAYFRPALVRDGLSASQIVLVEDLLIALCFVPFAGTVISELRGAPWRTWLALAAIAAGPQAFATVLFTRSLNYATTPGAESEVYLLYLLQPVFGLALAWLVLGERRPRSFWPLAATALVGAALIVTAQLPGVPTAQIMAALFVLGAVVLWAAGTVLGRLALSSVSFTTTSAMRFALALPILLILMLASSGGVAGFSRYALGQLPAFLGIALIPGVLAMVLYYRSLSSTPASISTLAELGYPAALFLVFSLPKPYGFGTPLRLTELAGALILVFAVTAMNWLKHKDQITSRTASGPHLAAQSGAK